LASPTPTVVEPLRFAETKEKNISVQLSAILAKIKASDFLTPYVLTTTTPNIEGKRIKEYLGIVTGEAVLGANLFRDLFAGLRDIVGGRSGAYEKELRKARDLAFEEIAEAAQELGANAVVGIDIDYEVLGEKNGMLMVSVSGTAVIIE
jgi:uncharacterized protein YbjQ (UPF0145 family)